MTHENERTKRILSYAFVGVVVAFLLFAVIAYMLSRENAEQPPENTETVFSLIEEYKTDITSALPEFDIETETMYTLKVVGELNETRITLDIDAFENRLAAVTLETDIELPPMAPTSSGSVSEAEYYELKSKEYKERVEAFRSIFMAALEALPGSLRYTEVKFANAAFDAAFSDVSSDYKKTEKQDTSEITFILSPDDVKSSVSVIIIPLTESKK